MLNCSFMDTILKRYLFFISPIYLLFYHSALLVHVFDTHPLSPPPVPRPLPTQNFPYGLGAIILLKYQKYKTCVVSNLCDELWQNINYFIFILFYIIYYFNYLLLYIF